MKQSNVFKNKTLDADKKQTNQQVSKMDKTRALRVTENFDAQTWIERNDNYAQLAILNGKYRIKNKQNSDWYYVWKPLSSMGINTHFSFDTKDYSLEAKFKLLKSPESGSGDYGIVWGVDKKN